MVAFISGFRPLSLFLHWVAKTYIDPTKRLLLDILNDFRKKL